MLHHMRLWDARTANGVDHFISNSEFIARRVWKTYRRTSTVIYPPVDTNYFQPGGSTEDFYLTASRLVPYKRINLIVEAFAEMPARRLVVIGDGPEFARVKRRAPSNVELLGYQPRDVVRSYMQRARAFVFAAIEDFGIVPVEAQACGTPVVALGRGGVAESVVDGRTGTLYEEQSAGALVSAIGRFESSAWSFNPATIREHALRFSTERFMQQFRTYVDTELELRRHNLGVASASRAADRGAEVAEAYRGGRAT
jgi:glycosyltransferase involved in cell wall biosynthesis